MCVHACVHACVCVCVCVEFEGISYVCECCCNEVHVGIFTFTKKYNVPSQVATILQSVKSEKYSHILPLVCSGAYPAVKV